MKLTLQVNGRKMTFSKNQITTILEKHLANETTKQQPQTAQVVKIPTENQWFDVNPLSINQKLFQKKRRNGRQEKTRQLILEAFTELKSNPQKYGRRFETMFPKKTWSIMSVAELEEMASNLGDHNANWVEQALEWAQRIYNGESWRAICNDADTADCCRLVIWKNGLARIIGGSSEDIIPATNVFFLEYSSSERVNYTVPLPVRYK